MSCINRQNVFLWVMLSLLSNRILSTCQVSALSSGAQSQPVPRISKQDFDAHIHYLHGPDAEFPETPVIVENVLDLSVCQQLCDTLWSVRDTLEVDVQRKKQRGRQKTRTDIYSCTLQQAVNLMMKSRHDDAVLIFEEGLLSNHPTLLPVIGVLTDAREALFADEDWLAHFPSDARPTDCVVMAGEGATSTLHRDPLEWTGTSICLEGSKVWRFLPPTPHVSNVDQLLASYRLKSLAWDQYDDMPLSAGWQSDSSLYVQRSKDIPSAAEFDEMPEETKWNQMESIASNVAVLQPNIEVPHVWTAVQRPGDMLVIPAYWWHQTYALEPSIAVASQRSGTTRDASRLVRHILETSGAISDPKMMRFLQDSYGPTSNKSPQQVLSELFDGLARTKDSRID